MSLGAIMLSKQPRNVTLVDALGFAHSGDIQTKMEKY